MQSAANAPVSIQPSEKVRLKLASLQISSLVAVSVLGAGTLAYWVIPPLDSLLPHFFAFMRANTSLLICLCALSIHLSMPLRARRSVLMSRVVGGIAAGFASLILLRDLGLFPFRIETMLAADAASIYPGKVSIEAAILFMLLGVILMGLRSRKSLLSHMTDGMTLLLGLATLIFLARYFFGLSHLFVLYQNNPFSVQTLICLLLLTFLVISRRAEYGLFAILIDGGNGGTTARLAVPVAILLPFCIAVPKAMLVRVQPDQESAATAVATSLLSFGAVCLVLLLGWRTKSFEATVRELSIRDELTGLYNRRGFYLLAEQALQLAKRPQASFSVLFIDLDNLKYVNDALGHDTGNELIKEMATILLNTFRQDDVIGRIGGDEFVVAGRSDDEEMSIGIDRLRRATDEANSAPNRKYKLNFSFGCVSSGKTIDTGLEELVTRADAIMYENKRRKRAKPAAVETRTPIASSSPA